MASVKMPATGVSSEADSARAQEFRVAEPSVTQFVQPSAKQVPRWRLLVVGSHVVQYSSPIFREMAQDPRFDLLVAYCSMQGVETHVDPGFGVEVMWDVPLLDGYRWVHVPNRSPRPRIGGFGLLNPGIWKLIRDGKFDAVYVSGYYYASAWIAILAAKWYGVPLIYTTEAHSLRSWSAQSNFKLALKKIMVRNILSLGDALLTASSGSAEQLRDLNIPEERIVLAPYVVDNAWWTSRAAEVDRDAVRRSWHIPSGSPVALFCAKLQPWKGPQDLLEAFARAGQEDSYLVFAGDGPLRNSLMDRASALGISDRVRVLGFMNQSQLPSVYCAADLLVLPSLYEPFGLVVNEAMLCGCPVIASDRVGAKFDLVRDGVNGRIFPAQDIEVLAAILRDLLADSQKRQIMGEAARERMETWSPRDYVRSMATALQRVAKSKQN